MCGRACLCLSSTPFFCDYIVSKFMGFMVNGQKSGKKGGKKVNPKKIKQYARVTSLKRDQPTLVSCLLGKNASLLFFCQLKCRLIVSLPSMFSLRIVSNSLQSNSENSFSGIPWCFHCQKLILPNSSVWMSFTDK